MFGGKVRQYPYLVTYLHDLAREPGLPEGKLPLRAGLQIFSIWGAVTVAATLLSAPFLVIPAAVVAISLGAIYARGNRPEPTPQDIKRDEAREVGEIMRKCLDLRRLHRDLDEGSLILIEECARHWGRVQAVFSTGFWNNPNLPPAYHSARRQALQAADDGMHDVLLLYRPHLPLKAEGRQPLDYIEEAMETYVFKGPVNPTHAPPAFVPARQIAEKLRDLATEAEVLASGIDRERISAPSSSTTTLEVSLGELRAIRQAEDELQQNLRG